MKSEIDIERVQARTGEHGRDVFLTAVRTRILYSRLMCERASERATPKRSAMHSSFSGPEVGNCRDIGYWTDAEFAAERNLK